jgi:hypothetical protein
MNTFDYLVVILTALVSIEFLLIAFFYFKYKNLVESVSRGDLIKLLDNITQIEKKNSKEIKTLFSEIRRLDEEMVYNIQKVGFVRFNPFRELGGDHSFCIAILDRNDNGFLLTGLHTRERTRIYAKEISKGKSLVDLSAEEKKALTNAQKSK